MPRATHKKIDSTFITKPQINAEESPLLKLPAELRGEVYTYALTADGALDITHDNVNAQTALLKVCHQIRLEAKPIFHGTNTFLITKIQESYTHRFLEDGGSSMLRRVPVFQIWLSMAEELYGPASNQRDRELREVSRTTYKDALCDLAWTLRSYGIRVDQRAWRDGGGCQQVQGQLVSCGRSLPSRFSRVSVPTTTVAVGAASKVRVHGYCRKHHQPLKAA
jgi:hypothetical protein